MTEVYRGHSAFVHIADGQRKSVGSYLATVADQHIRALAIEHGMQPSAALSNRICPGCYMVVLFNMAGALADRNGQSLSELANSMIGAFEALRDAGIVVREDIEVILDPC